MLPAQSAPLAVPYTYRNVAIVAGGFITGFVAQPAVRGLYYVRTDIGGAYRWDAGEKRWSPLLDWLPFAERNLLGVESFAVDPTDAKRLYLAVGTYVNGAASGAILRSSDQGRHFETIKVPFKMGANNDGRFAGERLQVDPNHPEAMLMGTREDGLWSSADRGMTWRKVSNFRDVVFNDDGLTFVAYDRSSGAAGSPTPVIFVGMANPVGSLARSDDNGRTWKVVAGGPSGVFPNHGVFAADGTLYLSYTDAPGPNGVGNGGVWAYTPRTGTWRDVTPREADAGEPRSRWAGLWVWNGCGRPGTCGDGAGFDDRPVAARGHDLSLDGWRGALGFAEGRRDAGLLAGAVDEAHDGGGAVRALARRGDGGPVQCGASAVRDRGDDLGVRGCDGPGGCG